MIAVHPGFVLDHEGPDDFKKTVTDDLKNMDLGDDIHITNVTCESIEK